MYFVYIKLPIFVRSNNSNMKATYNTIESLEQAIAESTNKFKTKDLKERLSWMKAREKGQFVTKEHLVELRNLIIWKINRSLYFTGNENLKKAMSALLLKVEGEKIVYRTEKGIKGLVMDAVVGICRNICFDQLVEVEGSEILTNSNLRVEGTPYARFQSFYLNLLMGR